MLQTDMLPRINSTDARILINYFLVMLLMNLVIHFSEILIISPLTVLLNWYENKAKRGALVKVYIQDMYISFANMHTVVTCVYHMLPLL